jgi:hypothetical protein
MAPRLLLCSPAAEGSHEARLLQQRGLQLKVSGTTLADLVLPVRGGSLAFLLFADAEGSQELVDRATAAARASRRTVVLWTGPLEDGSRGEDAALALQNAWCAAHLQPRIVVLVRRRHTRRRRRAAPPLLAPPSPPGVSVLRCERREEAAEHILACEQRATEEGAASAAQLTQGEIDEVIDGVHTHLAEVWGVEKHDVRPAACMCTRRLRRRSAAPLPRRAAVCPSCHRAGGFPARDQASVCARPRAERG